VTPLKDGEGSATATSATGPGYRLPGAALRDRGGL